MVERLIPKYPAFLIIGLVMVASGLFMFTAARDALIGVWASKLFGGETDRDLFEVSQTADQVIGHTLSVWLFLGLTFIKLGIGFAIATIVQNLRATGQGASNAFRSAGVPGADESRFSEPWFGRIFPKLLLAGILVMGFFFLLTLWWDANLVLLKRAEFDGNTTGASYEVYLIIERVLDAIIGAGKFLGEGLMIFGILTGLVTIIWHLSFQAKALPVLTRRALRPEDANAGTGPPEPSVPSGLLKLGVVGFSLSVLATPLALIRSGFIGWALGRQFEGTASEIPLRLDGILGRTIDPLTNLGLGILFFTIAFLLLTIIRWLREQRRSFGEVVADLSDGEISRPVVERSLWPDRAVAPLAIFGLFVVGFFFTMTAVRELNFNNMLTLQIAGDTASSIYQNAFRLDRILGPVIGATRFIGVASIMLAIGLALVTIVINLRATALLLPNGFSKLIAVARGEKPEKEDLTLHEPMSLAPWDLLRPLVAGVVVVITATLPIIILLALSTHVMLEEQFAGLGIVGTMSDSFKDSFLSAQILGATWQSWMLFGMGIILFAIGRFFSTIVGFVQARYMIIQEGTEAIAEAVISSRQKADTKT